MSTWWQFLLVIGLSLLFWFPQNVFHEGCHAIAVKFRGGKITAFKPYPHKRDGKLYFASVSWSINKELFPRERALISIAPWIGNEAVLLICFILNTAISNPVATAILFSISVVNFIDFFNNARLLLFASDKKYEEADSDVIRFFRELGASLPLAKSSTVGDMILVTVLLVLGAVPQ